MNRKDFLVSSAAAGAGLGLTGLPASAEGLSADQVATRRILIAGGGFGTKFIGYLAELTGTERPKLLYLPTASSNRDSSVIRWYENCAPLDVEPSAQSMYISSYSMDRSWEDVILSADGIVVSGGNTLNQQAVWRAQGIDELLREAWDRGIVLGGASAGSLCWFEEGTTDSRPIAVSKIKCLGFLKGSHSPHYDSEAVRRPTYHRLIQSGELMPGYACDNDAGIFFVDNEVRRVVKTREEARSFYVEMQDGQIVETELPGEMIG